MTPGLGAAGCFIWKILQRTRRDDKKTGRRRRRQEEETKRRREDGGGGEEALLPARPFQVSASARKEERPGRIEMSASWIRRPEVVLFNTQSSDGNRHSLSRVTIYKLNTPVLCINIKKAESSRSSSSASPSSQARRERLA